MNGKLLAPCGQYCGDCPNLKKIYGRYCSGCGNNEGRPFWGECRLYSCASEHDVDHCGLCADFPCDLFMGPPEGQRNTILRAGLLAYRRKFGAEKYLEMVKRIGRSERTRSSSTG